MPDFDPYAGLHADDADPYAALHGDAPAAAAAPKKPAGMPPSAWERVMRGWKDSLDGGTQLAVKGNEVLNRVTGGVIPKLPGDPAGDIAREQQAWDERAGPGFDPYRTIGSILSPANAALMFVPGGGLLKAGMVGAATGALEPSKESGDGFWADKAKQAGIGAAGGGVFNVAGRTAARVLSPNASIDPQLQMLRRAGTETTLGQTLGGGWNNLEQKMTSWPFLGNAIAEARGRSRETFNTATINRAIEPTGQRVAEGGHLGIGEAQRAVDDLYTQGRQMASGRARLDPQAIAEIQQVRREAAQMGPDFSREVEKHLDLASPHILPNGVMNDYQAVHKTFNDRASKLLGSPTVAEQDKGALLQRLEQAHRGAIDRTAPDAGQVLDRAALAYAQMARVNKAAGSGVGATNEGIFTPAGLMGAIRSKEGGAQNGAASMARGDGLMQDWAGAGQKVIGNTFPDSGTAGRGGLMGLAAGLFGGSAWAWAKDHPALAAALATGGTGVLAGYTRPGQRALTGLVANRANPVWQPTAEIMRGVASRGAPVASEGLLDYLGQ